IDIGSQKDCNDPVCAEGNQQLAQRAWNDGEANDFSDVRANQSSRIRLARGWWRVDELCKRGHGALLQIHRGPMWTSVHEASPPRGPVLAIFGHQNGGSTK